MRYLGKRVGRLEAQLGAGGKATATQLEIWAKVETIRRRRAERLGTPYTPTRWEDRPCGPIQFSLAEIISEGRARRRAEETAKFASDNAR